MAKNRAKFNQLIAKCKEAKALRHESLDKIPDLIRRFRDKELTPHEYMLEFQKIKDTVQRCQDNEMKWGAQALAYSGF